MVTAFEGGLVGVALLSSFFLQPASKAIAHKASKTVVFFMVCLSFKMQDNKILYSPWQTKKREAVTPPLSYSKPPLGILASILTCFLLLPARFLSSIP